MLANAQKCKSAKKKHLWAFKFQIQKNELKGKANEYVLFNAKLLTMLSTLLKAQKMCKMNA